MNRMLLTAGAGALAMYFLDPQAGRRRRAKTRDKAERAARRLQDAYDVTLRDTRHRAMGMRAEVGAVGRRLRGDPVDDETLVGRVRAVLGRYVSHPHAIDVAVEADLDEAVVVLGHEAKRVEAALVLPENARVIVNDRYGEGQSTSLAAGLRAVTPRSEAAVVLLGDQPGILSAEIRALVERFRSTGTTIVRLRYRDRPGPALLAREIWPDALALSGDVGARARL